MDELPSPEVADRLAACGARSLLDLVVMTMAIQQAAVWLDHDQAKVIHLGHEGVERTEVHIAHHLRKPSKEGGHAEHNRDIAEEHPFFDAVAAKLADAAQILVVGPAGTKNEFVKFVQERHKALAAKIIGVEPSDHPTDPQFLAYVRAYFLARDKPGVAGHAAAHDGPR